MDTPAGDLYQVLGVDRHASAADIKAAYRRLAMRYHPDRNPGDKAAEERFKEVSRAYAILSEPEQRERYDQFGQADTSQPFSGGIDVQGATDFFDAMLGDLFGWDRKRRAGEDLRYTLEIDFEEGALGCEKEIRLRRSESCDDCAGSGAVGGAAGLAPCSRCDGKGNIKSGPGILAARRECRACGGSGEIPRVRCPSCLGSGSAEKDRTFVVRVPAGTVRDSSQRIAGQGAPGRRGGPAGDLHVLLRIRGHAFYRTEGDKLFVEAPVTLPELALGTELEVPVLDGVIRMKVPAGTQSGAVFRVRGRGLPEPGIARGDVHVRVVVETPVEPDARMQVALAALQAGADAQRYPRRAQFQAVRAATGRDKA